MRLHGPAEKQALDAGEGARADRLVNESVSRASQPTVPSQKTEAAVLKVTGLS